MASNTDFVQYIADQCSGAGEIMTKKMFGDYGIYCDGKIFGLICDDCFYLKPTDAVRALLRVVDMRPPYDGATEKNIENMRIDHVALFCKDLVQMRQFFLDYFEVAI